MGTQRRGVRWRWLATAALVLLGSMALLGLLGVFALNSYLSGETLDPEVLRATVEDLLTDAPSAERSEPTVREASCSESDMSDIFDNSSATAVWTLPLGGQAEALDRIDERAAQLGYEHLGASVAADEPYLRLFTRDAQPTTVLVEGRDTPSGSTLTVAAYDTCGP